jgi:hypothetical protein
MSELAVIQPSSEKPRCKPYYDSMVNTSNQRIPRRILLAVLCIPILCSAILAQHNSQIFTVAAAKENATRLGSSQVLVRGHFWWGKEGSIIFDGGYKPVLRLRYSDGFNAKHSYHDLFPTGKTRKSDVATITGRLHLEANGKLVLIADDIQLSENPQ